MATPNSWFENAWGRVNPFPWVQNAWGRVEPAMDWASAIAGQGLGTIADLGQIGLRGQVAPVAALGAPLDVSYWQAMKDYALGGPNMIPMTGMGVRAAQAVANQPITPNALAAYRAAMGLPPAPFPQIEGSTNFPVQGAQPTAAGQPAPAAAQQQPAQAGQGGGGWPPFYLTPATGGGIFGAPQAPAAQPQAARAGPAAQRLRQQAQPMAPAQPGPTTFGGFAPAQFIEPGSGYYQGTQPTPTGPLTPSMAPQGMGFGQFLTQPSTIRTLADLGTAISPPGTTGQRLGQAVGQRAQQAMDYQAYINAANQALQRFGPQFGASPFERGPVNVWEAPSSPDILRAGQQAGLAPLNTAINLEQALRPQSIGQGVVYQPGQGYVQVYQPPAGEVPSPYRLVRAEDGGLYKFNQQTGENITLREPTGPVPESAGTAGQNLMFEQALNFFSRRSSEVVLNTRQQFDALDEDQKYSVLRLTESANQIFRERMAAGNPISETEAVNQAYRKIYPLRAQRLAGGGAQGGQRATPGRTAPVTAGQIPIVSTQESYDVVPEGELFRTPSGETWRKVNGQPVKQ